jgi:hypothetical protein
MTLPPLPWSYQVISAYTGKTGFIYILDANGRKIASLWGKPEEKDSMAELICDASDRAADEKKIADTNARDPSAMPALPCTAAPGTAQPGHAMSGRAVPSKKE